MVDVTIKEKNESQSTQVYGKVCYRKQRRKRQKILINDMMLDYAQNSSLHGLKYVAEKGRSVVEKLFWLLTFLVSVGMCFMLIRNVWIKWATRPVIVSINEQIVPVGEVPFPSVTICPQVKCVDARYNFSHEYTQFIVSRWNSSWHFKGSAKRTKKLADVALLCNMLIYRSLNSTDRSNSSLIDHIIEASPELDDVLYSCSWKNEIIDCDKLFKPVLTSEGVCFNFNSLAENEIFRDGVQSDYKYLYSNTTSRNWTYSKGYLDFDPDAYPNRARENGATPDLEVITRQNKANLKGFCNPLNDGYKIYIQHPADMPQSSLYYYAVLPDQVSSLALKFNMLSTDESLKDYDANVRQCYFPSDRPLRYFNIYTASNCRLECQSNYTFEKCGCVWYNMPHHDSRSICTLIKKECVHKAQDELSLDEIKAKQNFSSNACRCFPDCNSISYDAEILKSKYDWKTSLENSAKLYKLPAKLVSDDTYDYSVIEMYFKEPHFLSMRRSELFGLTDFLANCGGLLGLFLGFSFLSLVEIAYFLTLRLVYMLKRDLKQEKVARLEELENKECKTGIK